MLLLLKVAVLKVCMLEYPQLVCHDILYVVHSTACFGTYKQWGTEGGGSTPPPAPKFRSPSKIVQKSTRFWKLLKMVEFRMPTTQDVRKKGIKILKLSRFAIVLH